MNWKNSRADFSVYEMARKTWYLGAWINHSGWYPDFQRRLYDRDEARFSGIIHESVRFVGPPGRLHGDLLHYTVRSFEEHQAKVEKYTQLSAQQLHWEGKRYWRQACCWPRRGDGFNTLVFARRISGLAIEDY